MNFEFLTLLSSRNSRAEKLEIILLWILNFPSHDKRVSLLFFYSISTYLIYSFSKKLFTVILITYVLIGIFFTLCISIGMYKTLPSEETIYWKSPNCFTSSTILKTNTSGTQIVSCLENFKVVMLFQSVGVHANRESFHL